MSEGLLSALWTLLGAGTTCLPFHSELLADGISNYHGKAGALFFVPVTHLLNTLCYGLGLALHLQSPALTVG